MRLYYSPFACSFAAQIACREAGLEITLHRTDLSTKRVEGGGDLRELNPMGQVPTLVTDDGQVLTESSSVLMYIADRATSAQLAPARTSFAYYELLRWLSFVATELHKKCLAPIFAADSPEALKAHARAIVHRPLAVVEKHLLTRESLLGTGFSIADAHLWWALTIMRAAEVSLEPYPSLRAFRKHHLGRPAVAAALSFELEQQARAFQQSSSDAAPTP